MQAGSLATPITDFTKAAMQFGLIFTPKIPEPGEIFIVKDIWKSPKTGVELISFEDVDVYDPRPGYTAHFKAQNWVEVQPPMEISIPEKKPERIVELV